MNDAKVLAAVDAIKYVRDQDVRELHREELGAMKLSAVARPLRKFQACLSAISEKVLPDIPDHTLETIETLSRGFQELCGKSRKFKGTGRSAYDERDQMQVQAERLQQEAYQELLVPLVLSANLPDHFESLKLEAQTAAAEQMAALDVAQKELDGVLASAEAALAHAAAAAETAGFTSQATHFCEIAKKEEGRAVRWMFFTCVLGAVTLFLGFSFLVQWFPLLSYDSSEPLALYLASKFFLLGVIGFFLIAAARNFNAHKHNATVNRQREAAIKSFQAVAEGASEVDRSSILTHAAFSIFQPQDTGFLRGTREPTQGVPQIIEVLRSNLGSHH